MIQLLLHLIGDYITQSHWMAENKTKRTWPALCHAVVYSLPFLLLEPSLPAVWTIFVTHFFIDRFRLARVVVWLKNIALKPHYMGEPICHDFPCSQAHEESLAEWSEDKRRWSWENCSATGYPSEVPAWLSVWLLIAADNVLHLTINYAALKWL